MENFYIRNIGWINGNTEISIYCAGHSTNHDIVQIELKQYKNLRLCIRGKTTKPYVNIKAEDFYVREASEYTMDDLESDVDERFSNVDCKDVIKRAIKDYLFLILGI